MNPGKTINLAERLAQKSKLKSQKHQLLNFNFKYDKEQISQNCRDSDSPIFLDRVLQMISSLRQESLKMSLFEDRLLSIPQDDLGICRPIITECIRWVLTPPNLEILDFQNETTMIAGSLSICIKKLLQFQNILTEG